MDQEYFCGKWYIEFLATLCKSNTNGILDYCSFIDCLPLSSWFYWILKYANDYEQLWPFQNSNDKLTSKFWFVNSIFLTLLHCGKNTKKRSIKKEVDTKASLLWHFLKLIFKKIKLYGVISDNFECHNKDFVTVCF